MDDLGIASWLGSDVPVLDAGAKERASLRLRQHILESASASAPPTGRRRRPGRWVALAAAVAAGVVAVQALLPRGAGGPTPAQAALRRLAVVASGEAPLEVGPGEFVYTSSRQLRMSSQEDLATGLEWTFQVPVHREVWVAMDGSGRILSRYGEPVFASEADEAAWRSSGSPALVPEGGESDESYGPGGLPFYDVGSLPTDPERLAALIESRKILEGGPGDAETLNIIAILLSDTYPSPEIRAALFRVASELPGVELLGKETDPLGRSGIAVGLTEDGVRVELIFDEATAALLAQQRVDVLDETPVALEWRAYLASTVVGSDSERP